MRLTLAYLIISGMTVLMLAFVPVQGGSETLAWPLILSQTLLFVLLVGLSARLIGWHDRVEGLVMTALFLLIFLPTSELLFRRDFESLIALASQCIVPFFIGQYNRIRPLPFHRWYTLMLLMGIFCSYTHNGITIPLCSSFVWMAYRNRDRFFRTACWPMVIGFVIGTGLSIWKNRVADPSSEDSYLGALSSHTAQALVILWDTKIFIPAIGLTAYLSANRWGRKLVRRVAEEHTLLSACVVFSFCTMPFAPLGLDNAIQGVCFFCMYWTLILGKELLYKVQRLKRERTD